jgi:xylan 1,4-beta-xylosidase
MPIEINVSAKSPGKPFEHFWSLCVGAGRANEGLRAGWLEQLKLVHDQCGFRYCRFHGLFHDDMFVYRQSEAGTPIYNFQYIDELFDRILAIGVKPFVEFGFSPADMATYLATIFWWKANGSPPKDYTKWGQLIDRTVRHWIERYGLDEVRSWYFEVWNEPNLNIFFKGTKSQYFELYRVTVDAVKAIDASLRVGGPATSSFVPDARFAGETEDVTQHADVVSKTTDIAALDALDWRPVWLEDFLTFCNREKLPVDFVSCHPYPTDWALDIAGQMIKSTRGGGATPSDLATVRRIVDASAYPNAEIHLTEWSSSPSPRDFTHDYLQAATFVVRANIESIGSVDSLSYWTFTDVFEENGAGDAAFHGGFGMLTHRGIPKPTYHAYRFLNQLGKELIDREPGVIVTRRPNGQLAVLVYHYPEQLKQSVPASFDVPAVADATFAMGQSAQVKLTLQSRWPNSQLCIETLNRDHGNPVAAWRAMGAPSSPSPMQHELLQAAAKARMEVITADADGCFILDRLIDPWTVLFIAEKNRPT